MKTSNLSFRWVHLLPLFLLTMTISGFGQAGLIISQVYGGGGNSGSTFSNDFIELYNSSSAPIDLAGLSVQYASAAGSSWNAALLPEYNLAPGHYYLIQAAAGTTPSQALPTPDLILTLGPPSNVTSTFLINLSATAGKVALVSNATPLTVACPTGATILDFVGYGSTTCFEGSGAAPTTSNNTVSIIRSSTVDTNNNAADFTTVTPPNPRNTSFGTTAASFSVSGTATPAVVTSGDSTLLTVKVTPAVSPASTGISVVADLSLIGGSTSQAFYDDGTHGDTTAGDNVFSFTTAATTAASGPINLPVAATDVEGNHAAASIALTVNQPVPSVAIHDIQGVKSKTALAVSPYAGQVVQTSGIVTAITTSGFFIQSANPDANPLTPEGVLVYAGTGKVPASVVIGNLVQVSGTVATYPAVTASHTPATEIEAPLTVSLLSTGNPLPAPVVLTAADVSPSGTIYQLTPYEGMRVSFSSLTSTSGTDGSLNEAAETYTSNGQFYAVVTGTPRPFREPGIDLRDPVVDATKQTAIFDDNPERILVDSDTLVGATPINVSTGAVLPNVTGVLDLSYSADSYYDPARLLIDPAYSAAGITAGASVQPVPLPAANEFTVASFNIERFFNPAQATPDDLYYVPAGVNGYNGSSSKAIVSTGQTFISEAVDVTPAAYQTRLAKVSLAIRTVLNTPDVVTLEEVENQSVANDIANQINTDAGVPNLYSAYSTDNSTFFSQDGTGISVGFLVKNSTVNNLGFTQYGAGETFTPTTSTSPIALNDRPWLVLNAGIKRANAKDYPVTVIVNHMKALTGVNSTTSTSTRQKKELQAEDIAKYIQTLQAQGAHVISGGDFNAFEFSDGYTDTLATYTNTNVLPANQVVQPGVAGLVTPPLTDLALLLPPNQRWSYQEDGSAQILDHMVVTQDLVNAGAHLAYAHLDADFPVVDYNDPTTAARVSDHDAAVGYFAIPAPLSTATLTPATVSFGSSAVGVATAGQVFTFTNTGETTIAITSVSTTGDFAQSNNCGTSLAIGATCTINVVFTPKAVGTRSGTLQLVSNSTAGTYSSALSGTGTVAPNFTVTDKFGNTTTLVTVLAGTTGTANLVFTPTNGLTGPISLSCAAVGKTPAGVTCGIPANITISGASAAQQAVSFTTKSCTTGLLGRLENPGGCGTPLGLFEYVITATTGTATHTETVILLVL
jgi:uncharacterized protein